MHLNIKHWIKNNLFSKTGGFNNRTTLESWWTNRPQFIIYMRDINEATKFLHSHANMTERVYNILNDLSNKTLCYCGKETSFINYVKGYREYCSQECAFQSEKRNEKISQNNDYVAISEKMKKTNLERYGVSWSTELDSMKTKAKETKKIRYGNENYCNVQKANATNLEKYGVAWTGQAQSIIEKIQKKKDETIPELRDKEWLKEQNRAKTITEISEELSVTRRTVDLWFMKHNIEPNYFSTKFGKIQAELLDWIRTILGPEEEILSNDRNTIKPKELDIYIPKKRIAIELNGIYWHAEDRLRHIVKTRLCEKQNIRLIQIWDKEWLLNREICQNIIKHALGLTATKIYARNTTIRTLDNETYRMFLEKHHIQGYVPTKIRYGLFIDDTLVSCIGINKTRFLKNRSITHELMRYATKDNVIGGLSKLLNHAKKNNPDISGIISYCDRRFFTGASYEKTGFVYSHATEPGYFYYRQGKILNRIATQKHKLKKIIDNFDKTLSETKNMNNAGWLKVWDCGNKVYVKQFSS